MDINLTEDPGDTIRLLRPPPRVFTEARGQTVWMGEVRALELELESEAPEFDPYNSTQTARS